MKSILLLGAGRSSSWLIKYLGENGQSNRWVLTVADISEENARAKCVGNAVPIQLDINNATERERAIENTDLVISLLPPSLHTVAAITCIKKKKDLITASYVSEEIRNLDNEARKAGVILLNEIGLDPGIDHMSAMKIIDEVHADNGKIVSFKSYCGGLVAPESNDNPWGYKFSWNPRNVILAGQGTARYIYNDKNKFIPYSRVFSDIEMIDVKGLGVFDGYANRDSISYRKPYGLGDVSTILRGTLRNKGFCEAWNIFVQLGLTDDGFQIDCSELTWNELIESFLPSNIKVGSTQEKLACFMGISAGHPAIEKIAWLGMFDHKKIEMNHGSPAAILQALLEKKWLLKNDDRDMILMQHQFNVIYPFGQKKITSDLVVKGEDQVYTAMAKTVGLPASIAAKLVLQNKISLKGVQIPTASEIYLPVLHELETFGIIFQETTVEC